MGRWPCDEEDSRRAHPSGCAGGEKNCVEVMKGEVNGGEEEWIWERSRPEERRRLTAGVIGSAKGEEKKGILLPQEVEDASKGLPPEGKMVTGMVDEGRILAIKRNNKNPNCVEEGGWCDGVVDGMAVDNDAALTVDRKSEREGAVIE
ncbi:unnamed protein product [Sphenostylis stenocarpa]|uniref:Uncharacterized protein n=1 Tax=Sphenostylis stenocarpa TaxID=92480 RepID=A0AA86W4A7_9FABA|nr:unnamed protein product [Sphenostylis stenocarpa]